PAGDYVTYEQEYILIFRKEGKRSFASPADAFRRRRSAFFWEERNAWFSDLWTDLRGAAQGMSETEPRARSAAFPFELAHRIVCMYSLQGDTVLDPFAGTGTVACAAAAGGRSSIGVDIEPGMKGLVLRAAQAGVVAGQERTVARLDAHRTFCVGRVAQGKSLGHRHEGYGFDVMTAHETQIELPRPIGAEEDEGGVTVRYGGNDAPVAERQLRSRRPRANEGSLFGV
ncbi:MAG: DNA methyltransferase, partial [Phycisphaerales bacterium]